ncbi:GCN5-like N-acetyltransferase [Jackrogersella minutella]|nr:GCN5-like N-acetyltransferase [Jackrogersella minutella]
MSSLTPQASPMTVRPIEAAQTYALRHAVLWPNEPLSYVQLPDDIAGHHFGAFIDPKIDRDVNNDSKNDSGSDDRRDDCGSGELVSIISLFIDEKSGEARFRKFATAPDWQGRGVGSALLAHTIEAAATKGATSIWCDARQSALGFYRRFGMSGEGEVFFKGNVPYLRMSKALP